MKRPDTTYRLQLSQQFTFSDLEKIVDYLDDLGITTIYSAPIFQAKEGSTHGYDVLDPFVINKEIGDLDHLKAVSGRLNKKVCAGYRILFPTTWRLTVKIPGCAIYLNLAQDQDFIISLILTGNLMA